MSSILNKKIRIYWNLNKKCWSIIHNRKIIDYANTILVKNVKFIVSESGRQRVLLQKRKNVHAYAEGFIISKNIDKPLDYIKEINYNPYYRESFYIKESLLPIFEINEIFCENGKLYFK